MAPRPNPDASRVMLREGELISVDGRVGSVQRIDMTDQTVQMHWAGDPFPTAVTLDSIVFAVDLRRAGATPPQPSKLHLVTNQLVLHQTREKLAHALEAATGFRSGSPDDALPHEPRPEYDPAHVNLLARYENKAAALKADPSAQSLGVDRSARQLRRIAEAYLNGDPEAALDRRRVRTRGNRSAVTADVEKIIMEVFEELRTGSNISMRNRVAQIRFRFKSRYPGAKCPSPRTLERWHGERFTEAELGGKARTRRSATTPPEHGWFRQNPTYVGELAVADANHLQVLLKDTWLSGRVNGVLVVVIDWFSRSVLSLRVHEVAEKSVDVGRCMLDTARPKAMRADWGDDLRWPYAIPESMLMLPPGTAAAGLPYAQVDSWVFDHGSTFKARDPLGVARRMGTNILPARKGTGADKSVVERFFGAMNTMLLQWLEGNRGSDVSERGEGIEEKSVYTAAEFEDILLRWVIKIWQNHILEGVTPPWSPDGEWSPNRLYEESLQRHGVAQPLTSSDDYYAAFKPRFAAIKGRGVKIGRLWYDNRAPDLLTPFRDVPNPFGSGKEKNRHEFRVDPYDRRSIFWRHPQTGIWAALDWVAGPRETLPVFGDAESTLLERALRESRCKTLTQQQALEVLVRDVLRLDGAGVAPEDAKSASRRARAAENEVDTRRRYGVEAGGTPATDQRRVAQDAVDNARAEARRQRVREINAAAAQETASNRVSTTPLVPATDTAKPDLKVVPEAAPTPTPQSGAPRAIPTPAPPLGSSNKGMFPRRTTTSGPVDQEDQQR